MADSQVLKTVSAPVIPAEVLGFSVTVGLAPYPPDAPGSHRRAMYAELVPRGEKVREALAYIGRERILAMTPLTPMAVTEIEADPGGALAEEVATTTLAEAVRLAKRVA